MKLTDRDKRLIPIVIIATLVVSLLLFYPLKLIKQMSDQGQNPTYQEQNPPPATGEVRSVPPSWSERAISAWYEITSGEPIVAIIRQDIDAQTGAISPDGQYIATGGSVIRDVAISSVAEKRIVRKFALDHGNVRAVAFSPDGRYLATGRGFTVYMPHNESVNIWEVQSGKLIRNLAGPAGPGKIGNDVITLAFSPDSRLLAVRYLTQPDKEDAIHLFDVQSGDHVRLMHPACIASSSLVFFDGGRYLGCNGDEFDVYDVKTGERVQHLSDKALYTISPDGQYLAMATSIDKPLKIIDRQTGRDVKVLGIAKGYYRLLAYSPDGTYLVSSSDDALRLWHIPSGKLMRELKGHPDVMGAWMGFDAGGRYFSAVCNRYVVVWDFKKLISAGRFD
jgi:WD40 repeat protein